MEYLIPITPETMMLIEDLTNGFNPDLRPDTQTWLWYKGQSDYKVVDPSDPIIQRGSWANITKIYTHM